MTTSPGILHRYRLLLITLALLLPHSAWSLSICVPDTDFPPYLTHNGKDGITIHLLQDIAATNKLTLNFEIMSRPLCLYALKHNNTDAALGIAWGNSTRHLGSFPPDGESTPNTSDSLAFVEADLFRRRNNAIDFDGTQFQHQGSFGLAVQFGQPVLHEFVSNHGGSSIYSVKNIEQAFKMLEAGHVDGAVLISTAAQAFLATHEHYQNMIERTRQPVVKLPVYLVFSQQFFHKNPALAHAFWQGLRTAPLARKQP